MPLPRRSIIRLTILLLALSAIGNASHGEETESVRVLFLGNSVFYYRGGIAQTFEGFCRQASLNGEAVSQMREPDNAHGIEFLNFGRIPLNLPEVAASSELHALIEAGTFDFVILEARRSGFLLPEHAGLPEDRGQSIPYTENLQALHELHQTIVRAGAQLAIYMHPGIHLYPDIKHPMAQLYHRLRHDLEGMLVDGERHRVLLIPALYLWLDATRRYGIENWFADPGHGNALARYASGCLVFTFLTGRDPREIPFLELPRPWESPNSIDPGEAPNPVADWIKSQAWLYYTSSPDSATP